MDRKSCEGSHCPTCGSDDLISLSMTVSDAPVAFASCSTCEWKGWQRNGETLPLPSLLSLISTR